MEAGMMKSFVSSGSFCGLGGFRGLDSLRLPEGLRLDAGEFLGSYRRFGCRQRLAFRLGPVVELFDEFVACENSLLEIVGEFEGVLGTCGYAKHAERAASDVVQILVELAFLLPVGKIHHLCLQLDGAVGTVHLAYTAADALVASLLVVNEREFGPEAVGDLKSIPVLGILLGYLGSDELLSRDTHSQDETLDTASHRFEIFCYISHQSYCWLF